MRQRVHRLFKPIRDVLRAHWDPIPGSPEDEYDSYVWGLIGRLDRGEDDEAVARYLDQVVVDLMGLQAFHHRHLEIAADLRRVAAGVW